MKKNLYRKYSERSICFPWKISILISTQKGKGLNLKRSWVLVKKYNILFWRCLMGDVVQLPHVSTRFKRQDHDQRTSFTMQHGWLLVSSFPSPRALFCRTPCSRQMMDACGIATTILTRPHGSAFDSLFGVFTGKCSGFNFSGFYFSQECQTIPGGNKNNLQLVLVKSLIGGLPPIFYAFGF